jgi:ribose transport system substrate-binding protein
MRLSMLLAAVVVAGGCLLFTSCKGGENPAPTGKSKIMIGLVAKSQSNQVFQAAHQGARDAVKELADKYHVEITLNIQTPPAEDAEQQAQAVDQLAGAGAAGIIVSCSDGAKLKSAIDKAVERGVPVMTFDSDSPDSKRFACYGTDDISCGRRVASELAKVMNDEGEIAILAGSQAAPNLQLRAKGVRDEIANHPKMKIVDTVYHEETAEKAAAAVQAEQSSHPEIKGWAFIGGWPLFTRDALKWQPGTVKVVSVDALPPQLGYLESGHVQLLLAQDCYGWGYKSVETILNKVVNGENPPQVKLVDPLTAVTRDGNDGTRKASDFAKEWDKWLGK